MNTFEDTFRSKVKEGSLNFESEAQVRDAIGAVDDVGGSGANKAKSIARSARATNCTTCKAYVTGAENVRTGNEDRSLSRGLRGLQQESSWIPKSNEHLTKVKS